MSKKKLSAGTPSEGVLATLKNLYYDPTTGLQSASKLYRKANKLDSKITMKMVKDSFNQQESVQIDKDRKREVYEHIIAHHVNNGHQADLMDMSK